MKYLGTFLDGKQFDGNMDENFELKRAPFSFLLGKGQVIRGWDEGIQNFSVGSQGTLYLPSELAYGPNGNGRIPPNSVLIFQIEVVDAQ
jgi:FKBP-type peptidyl-prolyl cis-trans isomerase